MSTRVSKGLQSDNLLELCQLSLRQVKCLYICCCVMVTRRNTQESLHNNFPMFTTDIYKMFALLKALPNTLDDNGLNPCRGLSMCYIILLETLVDPNVGLRPRVFSVGTIFFPPQVSLYMKTWPVEKPPPLPPPFRYAGDFCMHLLGIPTLWPFAKWDINWHLTTESAWTYKA